MKSCSRFRRLRVSCLLVLGSGLGLSMAASATEVRVTLTNQAPDQGVYLTPLWLGFHDGSFDLYDGDSGVGSDGLPAGFESVVEDGINAPLMEDFAAASGAAGGIDATVSSATGPFVGAPVGRVYGPGDRGSAVFDLDAVTNRYLSYASMVIPSNDAFIANDDPTAYALFDDEGDFTGPFTIRVIGPTDVMDAGTEQNTETDAAFLNQMSPNSGAAESGTVDLHPGFNGSLRNPDGTPVNILGGTNPLGISFDMEAADFTADNYTVASIRVAEVPEPGVLGLMSAGLLVMGFGRYRRAADRERRMGGAGLPMLR